MGINITILKKKSMLTEKMALGLKCDSYKTTIYFTTGSWDRL